MISHVFSVGCLGLIAGVTEFIPVSSSAHVYLFSQIFHDLPIQPKIFSVLMQFCAIVVVMLYDWRFWLRLLVGCLLGRRAAYLLCCKLLCSFLPIALVGALIGHWIHAYFFSPWVMGVSLLLGGLVMLLTEWRLSDRRTLPGIQQLADLSYAQAFMIGCVQIIALIPGVSRSATTILSALWLGASRPFAVWFSFTLAVPTLFSASVYEMIKYRDQLHGIHLPWYVWGAGVTFVSAGLAVFLLMRYLSQNTLVLVALYRILLGLCLMVLFTGKI